VSRRVLVARLDSAGDVLVSGPAVRAIAAGADEVLLLAGPQGASAARLLPGVDRVAVWASPWIVAPAPDATPAHLAELDRVIREFAPDEAVILTSFHQSPLPLALALRLAGVRRITGASTDYAGSLLDVRLKPGEDFSEDIPEPERALTIARAAGFDPAAGDDGRLAVEHGAVPAALGLPEEPFVAVHPGAAVPARAWPASHHTALVEALAARGIRSVVTGGPAEAELTAQVAGAHGLDLGGRTDLATMAGVLSRAAVVVTGNTGPAHLAAAVGTPVVSLFSPVVPASRWAPYGVPLVLLGDQQAACRGSRARECPIAGHPCLSSVDPAEVVDACLTFLPGADAAPRDLAEAAS
jgi:ADP-heptose:LPS heptosyltransferase